MAGSVFGLADDAHPLTIRDAIEERTGRKTSRAAVFITLERLEDKGVVSSSYGDLTPIRGERAKRYFSATPAGPAAIRHSLATLGALTTGLEAVLEAS